MKKKVQETSTTSGSISTVSMPAAPMQRRGGNLLTGKKTSKKYANSISESHELSEEEIHEEELLLVPGQKPRNVGFIPKDHDRTDHEVGMAVSDLLQCGKNAEIIYNILRGISEEQGIPGWVQEKITKATDYLNTVAEYMEGQQHSQQAEGYGVIAGGTTMEGHPIYHGADKPAEPWNAIDRIAGGKHGVGEAASPAQQAAIAINMKKQGKKPKTTKEDVAEGTITEKAKSKKQQQFFGMVRAIQKGKKVKGASKELKAAAKDISKGDVKDFAKTKHKGLPTKVDESTDVYGDALSQQLDESMDRLLSRIVKEDAGVTPGGIGGSTHMFLEAEPKSEPRIRKYTKERPDGSVMTRWEVLDYRGHRASGQGTEGFDDPKNAKEFLARNKTKLSAPPGADDELNENLRDWFKEKWVRFGPDGKIRGDCARGDDSEGKPKCLPQSKAHALGKKGRASAAARKRREDPNPERSGKAINVNTKKKKADEGVNEAYMDLELSAIVEGCSWDSVVEWLNKNVGPTTIESPNWINGYHGQGWRLYPAGYSDKSGKIALKVSVNSDKIRILSDERLKDVIEASCGAGSSKQLDELKCWPNYTRVPGVPAGDPGSCKKKSKKATKEDISRRGLLRGIGAAALGGVAGGALSQPKQPTDATTALQGMSRDDPRVQHGKDVDELAKAIYDRMVAERGRPMDSTQQRKWMTIARTEAEKRLGQISQSVTPSTPSSQRQPSEVRRSSNINNFESVEEGSYKRMNCPECGGPAYEDQMLAEKQDACYHKVKSRYKVWPSAYASGALSKCRKVGAKNWGNKSKK